MGDHYGAPWGNYPHLPRQVCSGLNGCYIMLGTGQTRPACGCGNGTMAELPAPDPCRYSSCSKPTSHICQTNNVYLNQ